MSAIEKELVKVTKFKKTKGDDDQTYFQKLIAAADDLPDEDWDNLSKEARKWVNDGTKAINRGEAVAEFAEDDPPADEPEDPKADDSKASSADDDADEPEKKPAKKKSAAKDKAPAKEKAPAKDKAASKPAADKGGKREGVSVTIKKIMIARPNISAAELTELLEDQGYSKVSQFTVSTIRADFRNSLKVLIEAGLIDMEL